MRERGTIRERDTYVLMLKGAWMGEVWCGMALDGKWYSEGVVK